MVDSKLHIEEILTSDLSAGQQMAESDLLGKTAVESLSLLAGVALAPLCGKSTKYCTCLGVSPVEHSFHPLQVQLQFLINKADNMHKSLEEGCSDRAALAAFMPNFLYTCTPFFNQVESTVRSTWNQNSLLPQSTLLDFSQKLCNRLEKLVLTFARYGLLCLDEHEPNSISHFSIGQCLVGPIRLSMFCYCKLTPYLAQVDIGLYKRIRWNVERLQDGAQQQQRDQGENQSAEAETENTEYYFLCCEDINNQPDRGHQSISPGSNRWMWSIGKWVQVSPDTDDINDWILCKIPKGEYQRLLFLGSDEPSCSTSTDALLLLLFSQQND